MYIELDEETVLTCDDLQFILMIKYQKDSKGFKEFKVQRYYGSLKHALTAYIKLRQLRSNATSLTELAEVTNKLRDEFKVMFKEINI